MQKLNWVLGGLLFVTAAVAVNLWRELGAERNVTAQLREQLATPTPAATLPQVFAPSPAPVAATPAASAAVAAATAASAANSGAPARTPPAALPNFIADQQEMMKDPEFRAARLAQMRMNMAQMHPGLAEVLGLSPEDAARMLDVLAEFQLEMSTATLSTAVINGQQPDPEAMRQTVAAQREIQRRQDEAVASVLGAGGVEKWRHYQQFERPAYMQASQVNRMMEGAGQPLLNDSQQRAMREIYGTEMAKLREEQRDLAQRYTQSGGRPDAAMLDQQQAVRAEHDRRIVDAASRHLSPAQLETLRTSLEQQRVMSLATQRLMQQRQETQGQTGAVTVIQATPAAAIVLPPMVP